MMTVILVTFGAGVMAGTLGTVALAVLWRGCRHERGAPGGHSGAGRVRAGRTGFITAPAVVKPELGLVAVVTVVSLGAFAMILTMVEAHWGLADYDRGVASWAAGHASAGSTRLLRELTQLGGSTVLVPVTASVAGLVVWRHRRLEVVLFLTVAVGGQFLVVYLIKEAVDRARPDLLRLTGFSGPSFPSGHATAAAATFAALAFVLGRGISRWARSLLGGAAVGLAVAVAMTRVDLGVHWLTDILAGLCLGWAWFSLCSLVLGRSVAPPPAGG